MTRFTVALIGAIREDLPIEIVPTVGTAPTKLVFALLAWAEQTRIGLDHHSATATARI
jgi:hypothetical protein